MQRALAVGRALLRVQPDVVRQLLDVDERADGILDIGIWSEARGCENSSRLLNGFILSRTP